MPENLTSWDFLKKLYDPTDTVGVIAFEPKDQALKASASAKQFIVLASEAWSPGFQSKLRQLNAKGLNISVGANPLRTGAVSRTKAEVGVIRYLFLDLDTKHDVTGKQKLDTILGDPKCPAPGFILNTSPSNYQVLWRVEGFGREEAEQTLRRLAAHYGGDPAIGGDISRAIRIAGFRNKKYAVPNPQQNVDTRTAKEKEYGPTITGITHSDLVHAPTSFEFLPALERQAAAVPPISQSSQIHHQQPGAPRSASTLPNGFDPENRTPYQGSGRSASGGDDSSSGKDYGHGNELIVAGLRQGRALAEILPEVRTYLEQSAATRGRRDGVRYAEFTINNPRSGLRVIWEAKQAEYMPRPQRPVQPQEAPAVDVPSAAPVLSAPRIATEPVYPATQAPQNPPPSFQRSHEDRDKDAFYIVQSLRDGQTPIQIRENMLEWLFKEVQGANEYVHAAIVEAQTKLRAEDLVSSATRHIQQYGTNEVELYRSLLQQLPAGEGALRSAVAAVSKAAELLPPGALPPPARLNENPDAGTTAFHLAALGFNHSDTARSIEVALTAKYHHDAIKDGIPAQIIQIVQQASLIKNSLLSTFSPEQQHDRPWS